MGFPHSRSNVQGLMWLVEDLKKRSNNASSQIEGLVRMMEVRVNQLADELDASENVSERITMKGDVLPLINKALDLMMEMNGQLFVESDGPENEMWGLWVSVYNTLSTAGLAADLFADDYEGGRK